MSRVPSGEEALFRALLEDREARAAARAALLERFPLLVVLSLHLPGLPQRIPGDRAILAAALARLRVGLDRPGEGGTAGERGGRGALPPAGRRRSGPEGAPEEEVLSWAGAAGAALLWGREPSVGGEARAEALRIKRAALSLEESLPWGRALDLDVWTREGAVGRAGLGLPERPCLLCGLAAKRCAREGGHPIPELRQEALRLLALPRGGGGEGLLRAPGYPPEDIP